MEQPVNQNQNEEALEKLLPEFTEFESKYRVEGDKLTEWKQLVSSLDGVKNFKYVESDDIYYTRNLNKGMEYEFVRYRSSNHKQNKRAELTIKSKTSDSNNIRRYETNLRVDSNDKATVESFVNGLGFKKNFRICKPGVHIYEFDEVTLPFYTVVDEAGNIAHFMEIEINEILIPKLTETEAWDIIRKYESILAPIGISAQKRLKKSLFEMYKKEG